MHSIPEWKRKFMLEDAAIRRRAIKASNPLTRHLKKMIRIVTQILA